MYCIILYHIISLLVVKTQRIFATANDWRRRPQSAPTATGARHRQDALGRLGPWDDLGRLGPPWDALGRGPRRAPGGADAHGPRETRTPWEGGGGGVPNRVCGAPRTAFRGAAGRRRCRLPWCGRGRSPRLHEMVRTALACSYYTILMVRTALACSYYTILITKIYSHLNMGRS